MKTPTLLSNPNFKSQIPNHQSGRVILLCPSTDGIDTKILSVQPWLYCMYMYIRLRMLYTVQTVGLDDGIRLNDTAA